MDLRLSKRPAPLGWAVTMAVALDRQETNDLFLAGDKLISWPTEGMMAPEAAMPLSRSSMFLSEIVARPSGLELCYETEEQADRAAQQLSWQVRSALGSD